MRKFILQNKVAIIAVALVMCLSVSCVVVAQTSDSTILDRIVMTYLNLKASEQGNVGEAEVGMNSMLIEDHFPYFRINDGMYTAKDIYTTGETTLTGGLIYGTATSTITATTTAGDLLLTAAQVCDNGYIDLTADIETGAFTLTFPTATLLYADCLNANDDTKDSLWVYNLSGSNATITAGTGGKLVEENGEDVVIGTGHWAECEIKMMDDGASYLLACTEWQDAD